MAEITLAQARAAVAETGTLTKRQQSQLFDIAELLVEVTNKPILRGVKANGPARLHTVTNQVIELSKDLYVRVNEDDRKDRKAAIRDGRKIIKMLESNPLLRRLVNNAAATDLEKEAALTGDPTALRNLPDALGALLTDFEANTPQTPQHDLALWFLQWFQENDWPVSRAPRSVFVDTLDRALRIYGLTGTGEAAAGHVIKKTQGGM